MDAELNDKLPERIEGALRALDRDAVTRAEAVDSGRIAERVLARLRDEPVRELYPRRVSLRGLRIAAVLAVLVIGGVVTQRLVLGSRQASYGASALPVLPPPPPGAGAGIDAGQQEAMLAAVEDARSASTDSLPPATSVTVEDLNVQELQALLSSMDDHGGTE